MFMENEWSDIKFEGRGDYVLKEKLKMLRNILTRWKKEVFGWIELKIEEEIEEVNEVDGLIEECQKNQIMQLASRRDNP